jgi:hypothetical protein
VTPSIDLRIATLIRAVKDVIAPAIDQNNHLAKEQAALVVGQLKLLAAQWNKAADYAAVCRADLAQALAGLEVDGAEQTREAYATLADALAAAPGRDAEADYKALMRCADELVRAADADGSATFRKDLRARLLAFSQRQALRDRSWFALSGFDLRPQELSSIDAMIGRA